MRKEKQEKRNEKMLQEFREFVKKYGRAPKVKEITFENGFSYTYQTYRACFKTIRNLVEKSDSKKLIPADILQFAKNANRSQFSGYNTQTMAGKIRKMLTEYPDAGYEELEELMGPLNRSIRVTYYRIHREMCNKGGSLRIRRYEVN